MRRRMIAAAATGAAPARFFEELPDSTQPRTLEQLVRELEVLRGKIHSLNLAQQRIERSAEELNAAITLTCRQMASLAKPN